MAMTASPSTIWPFSSMTITRSASPSSAMPICAPLRLTTSAPRVLGVQRAAVAVDVHAVRACTPMAMTLAPSSVEDERRDVVGGAVGGVDDDAHAVEREVAREGGLGEDDVAAARVLELLGAADAGPGLARAQQRSRRPSARSISASASSGSLKPSAAEDLDAVVLVRVVAGADHDAGVGAHATVRCATAGVGIGPAEHHAAAHRADAGGERRLEHVAGEARVLADHDARRVALAAAGHEGDRAAEAQRQLRASSGARWPRRGCRRCRTGASRASRWSSSACSSVAAVRTVTSAGAPRSRARCGPRGRLHLDLDPACPGRARRRPARACRPRGRRPRRRARLLAASPRSAAPGRSPSRRPRRAAACAGAAAHLHRAAPSKVRVAVRLADAGRDLHPRRCPGRAAAGRRGRCSPSSATVSRAPSTETGSVNALSISCTRLLGPAMRTSAGLARRPPPPRSPRRAGPSRRGRTGTDLLQRALEVEGEDRRA